MVGEWTRIKNAGHEASWRSVVCWWSAAVDDIQGQECWEGYRKVKEQNISLCGEWLKLYIFTSTIIFSFISISILTFLILFFIQFSF